MFETTLFSGMHHERKLLPILIHLFHHLWCKMINHLHEIIKDLNLPRRQLLPPLLSNWWIMENLSRQTQFNCNIKIQMPQIKGLHGREVQRRELPEVELRQEFLTELACRRLMKVWLLKKVYLILTAINFCLHMQWRSWDFQCMGSQYFNSKFCRELQWVPLATLQKIPRNPRTYIDNATV